MFVIQYMCWGQSHQRWRTRPSIAAENQQRTFDQTFRCENNFFWHLIEFMTEFCHTLLRHDNVFILNVSQNFVPRHFYIKKGEKNGIKSIKNLIRKIIFDMRCGEIKSIKYKFRSFRFAFESFFLRSFNYPNKLDPISQKRKRKEKLLKLIQ
jgi:hypothetical protein